jgi:hypothetical protein
MNDTRDDVAAGLRAWARGALNLMAAVEFLLETGATLSPHLVRPTGYEGKYYRLDVFHDEVDDAEWAERIAGMSGGQVATWTLVRSLCDGELSVTFWRLDVEHKLAFVAALGAGLEQERAAVVALEQRVQDLFGANE